MTHGTAGPRSPARDLVLAHLRQRGTLPDPVSLPVGIPGVTVRQDGRLAVDGYLAAAEPRRLSDLLRAGGHNPVYLADRAAAAASRRHGYDPLLYWAVRHFLPPRQLNTERCVPAGGPDASLPHGPGYLLADLVVYQPGVLPGGEPYRSTGHWNLPGQLEVFQTLTGRVAMLVAGHTVSGKPFVYQQVCGPGEMMAVPFGIWHTSYALDGPAAVFNVTTDLGTGEAGRPAALPHGGQSHGTGIRDGKYRRAEPLAITARWHGARLEHVGSPAALRAWGQPAGAPRTDWLAGWLACGESLADLHLYGAPTRLTALVQAAREAYHQDWPVHDGFHPA